VLNEDTVVNDLIDNDTRWWDLHLIKEVVEEEASSIFQIPISSYNGNDIDLDVFKK
jgi:hypothetical protein